MKSVHLFLGIGAACAVSALHPDPAGATTCSTTGGCSNTVSSDYSGVLSGGFSSIGTAADWSVIDGGDSNYIAYASDYGAIAGGYSNQIASYGPASFIGGGYSNYIYGGTSSNVGFANTIMGGRDNGITAVNDYSFIGGGLNNTISAASGIAATIGGGENNQITAGNYGTILGGYHNTCGGSYASVAGGSYNVASGLQSAALGGAGNSATGSGAVTVGGDWNIASGAFSLAAGRMARADQQGCFVWADSIGYAQTCKMYPAGGAAYSAMHSFVVRATGGVELITHAGGLPNAGVYLGAGSSVWAQVSDRNKKHDFQDVDVDDTLRRVVAMPITTWEYKAEASAARHMGPMAQDLYASFGLGDDDKHVTSIDEDGIAMAAIQGLHAQVQERNRAVGALQERVSTIERNNDALERATRDEDARAAALEARLARLQARLAGAGAKPEGRP